MDIKDMKKFFPLIVILLAVSMSAVAQTKAFTDSIVVGDKAPDVTAPDTLGVSHSLSDFKGQWVLLDFWASWCGDCRREIPAVKAIAEKYPELAIFGYSMDRTPELWRKAIRHYDLSWTNVSFATGWDHNASPYGIRWIPTTFLINPEGTVVAVSLNETDLLAQVEQFLGKK